MARKPMVGSLAENWIAHGTGSLNIDATRIGTGADVPAFANLGRDSHGVYGNGLQGSKRTGEAASQGRFPPNLILTDPILDGGWEGVVGGGETGKSVGGSRGAGMGASYRLGAQDVKPGLGDSGTYSRFFLIPKAPTRERVLSDGRRSPHPTQKPEALIRHLVTLVTPPGGLVLDPFLGSGTLGVVCDGLGMRWQGIEREPEYADWAEARIADKAPAWEAA
jgi:site-specific DNA-methyltransferase (adenine-specific)